MLEKLLTVNRIFSQLIYRRCFSSSRPVSSAATASAATASTSGQKDISSTYWNNRYAKNEAQFASSSVAIHSDVDSHALHVRLADERVCVGPAPVALSYLNIDAILDAVDRTKAEAVHPGYGFLSENTNFASKLESIGVVFVGPSGESIRAMGDKIESKRIALAANVNTIPGFDGEVQTADEAVRIAQDIGYPVMLKASAGGGGKGMRIAWNEREARDAFRLARDEARSSFGDDRLLIEKYIDRPRHIEMQVLCDKHGNALYLNERECSIQRRNQKVIEEAPSTFLDDETRRQMGQQAVQLARAVHYTSAGTVEFLIDSQRQFYFLEMNTRLQVEHPVTELITGIDLVHQMLRIANGHQLLYRQDEIPLRGWAVESRVYAEDPYKSFGLPSVGRLTRYREPVAPPESDPDSPPTVRCDSGISEGSEISIYYDPMICKLITFGPDRNAALHTMVKALDDYVIRGVLNNIPLLRDICTEKRFIAGDLTTDYLPEVYPDGFQGAALSAGQSAILCATATLLEMARIRRDRLFSTLTERDSLIASARSAQDAQEPFLCTFNERTFHVSIESPLDSDVVLAQVSPLDSSSMADRQTLRLRLNSDSNFAAVNFYLNFNRTAWSEPLINLSVDDDADPKVLQIVRSSYIRPANWQLQFHGTRFNIQVLPERLHSLLKVLPARPKVDEQSIVTAPMPGVLKSIAVAVGDQVAAGQELCVLEAMKMQNSLLAGRSGKVKAVRFEAGQTVDEGDTIVELEKTD